MARARGMNHAGYVNHKLALLRGFFTKVWHDQIWTQLNKYMPDTKFLRLGYIFLIYLTAEVNYTDYGLK